MNLSLLIGLFSFVLTGPQLPNHYRTYPAARAASAKGQKDMLIFFNSSACNQCSGAWTAFTQDPNAVNNYISTQVAVDDFDGQILDEYFNPGEVPSWVILDASGKVKEKWQGGWKDAYGKGTLYVNDPVASANVTTAKAENKKPMTSTPPTTTSVEVIKPNSSISPDKKESLSVDEPKTAVTVENAKPASNDVASGYLIQAGYFSSSTNAERCLADLKAKGFRQFSIHPLQQNGSTFYRVWSNSYPTEQIAQSQLQQMAALGIKATLKSPS